MRTYQLSRNTPDKMEKYSIYVESISTVMNCDDFLKYLKDDDEISGRDIFTKINHDYLNSLNIGKNKLLYCYNIHVSNIPIKMRTYTLDNGNDLFPEDYNVSSLNEFKTVLTTFYNEIIKSRHKISIKLEDIIDTNYLTSLLAGPYPNTIHYYLVNDVGEKIDNHSYYFNIYVSEFDVE